MSGGRFESVDSFHLPATISTYGHDRATVENAITAEINRRLADSNVTSQREIELLADRASSDVLGALSRTNN